MIMSGDKSTIVNGVSLQGRLIRKRADLNDQVGTVYVVDENGKLKGADMLYVFDNPAVYFLKTVNLVADCVYSLSGTCAPVGKTVHCSLASEDFTINDLRSNIVKSIESDDEGNFALSDLSGLSGPLHVWVEAPANYAQTGFLTCECNASVNSDTGEDGITQQAFVVTNQCREPCITCNAMGYVHDRSCDIHSTIGWGTTNGAQFFDTPGNSYQVFVYDYKPGAIEWHQVHLYYSISAFSYDGSNIINLSTVYERVYFREPPVYHWEEKSPIESVVLSPGLKDNVFRCIFTNYDILDANGAVYMASCTMSDPPELEEVTAVPTGDAYNITASSGDGYSLYNGTKLPNIDSVWKDVKTTYGYATIVYSSLQDKWYTLLTRQPIHLTTDSRIITSTPYEAYVELIEYVLTDNTWICTRNDSVMSGATIYSAEEFEIVWSSQPFVHRNGYATYNGVELPDIDIVWTDKATYQTAYIRYMNKDRYSELGMSVDVDGYEMYVELIGDGYGPGAYFDPGTSELSIQLKVNGVTQHVNFRHMCWLYAAGGFAERHGVESDTWILVSEEENTTTLSEQIGILWSNRWIYENTTDPDGSYPTYIRPSTPEYSHYSDRSITNGLSGQAVIEWNGVTNNLISGVVNGDTYYKVSDFVPDGTVLATTGWTVDNSRQCVAGTGAAPVKVIAVADVTIGEYAGVFTEPGLYFVNSNGVYTTLFAFKHSICTDCGGLGIIQCPSCHGTHIMLVAGGNIRYTITGTCPSDATGVNLALMTSPVNGTENWYLSDTKYSLNEDGCFPGEHLSAVTPTDSSTGRYYSITKEMPASGGSCYEMVVWCPTETDEPITVDSVVYVGYRNPCLAPNTPIEMSDGSTKTIDDLQVGDYVMSQHGAPTRVYHISRGYFNDHHTLYTFEDGSVVDETSDHRFFNVEQGFWQFLKYWNIGEHAIKSNGETVALVSIERIDEEAEKCGVWTDDGSYYANGFLTGTATNNKPLLATATAEQAVDMMMSVEEYRLLQLLNIGGVLP